MIRITFSSYLVLLFAALVTLVVLPTVLSAQSTMSAARLRINGVDTGRTVITYHDAGGFCSNGYIIEGSGTADFSTVTYTHLCKKNVSSSNILVLPKTSTYVRMFCDTNGNGVIDTDSDRRVGPASERADDTWTPSSINNGPSGDDGGTPPSDDGTPPSDDGTPPSDEGTPPADPDGDDTRATATTTMQVKNQVLDRENDDVRDYYTFTITERKKLRYGVRYHYKNNPSDWRLRKDSEKYCVEKTDHDYADLLATLESSDGTQVAVSGAPGRARNDPCRNEGFSREWLSVTLEPGTYYIKVEAQADGKTSYYTRFSLKNP